MVSMSTIEGISFLCENIEHRASLESESGATITAPGAPATRAKHPTLTSSLNPRVRARGRKIFVTAFVVSDDTHRSCLRGGPNVFRMSNMLTPGSPGFDIQSAKSSKSMQLDCSDAPAMCENGDANVATTCSCGMALRSHITAPSATTAAINGPFTAMARISASLAYDSGRLSVSTKVARFKSTPTTF